jgi:hypothetical protein
MTQDEMIAALTEKGYSDEIESILKSLADYTPSELAAIVKWFPHTGDATEFNGMNCNDYSDAECDGWDGWDGRCNCGNRRVYWVVEGDYAYGEAD